MTIGEKIKLQRKALGLTQTELGAKLGVQKNAVSKWECGRVDDIPSSKIKAMAQLFNVPPSYLIDDNSYFTPHAIAAEGNANGFSHVQYAGPVAAHFNATPVEEHELRRIPPEWLGNRQPEDFFIASVDGNSMYPHYQHGDDILCLRCSDMGYSGRVGIMVFGDGEATLKKIEYKAGEGWIDLVPFNPEYTTKRIEGADLEQCRVVGRVIRVIRAVDDI